MKLLIISGSIRQGRRTHRLAEYLHQCLALTPEVQSELIDLYTLDLPMLSDRWAAQDPPPAKLATFSQKLHDADAMIWVSPEYHGSYTGVLKNAIDHYWKEFAQKPIGVATTSTGKHGGINASLQMQHLVLSLGAYPVPQKLLVSNLAEAFAADGTASEELQQQVEKYLRPFLWFCRAITQARQAS